MFRVELEVEYQYEVLRPGLPKSQRLQFLRFLLKNRLQCLRDYGRMPIRHADEYRELLTEISLELRSIKPYE